MKVFFKYLYRTIIILLIIAFVMFVGLMIFIGDSATSCNEDSEAVAYARSLSQERLKRLYYDMENYSSKTDLPIDGFQFYDKNTTIPQEFDDLEVIKVRPDDGNIMIEGCFDHYVYLQFKGIGRFKEHEKNRQIVLSWGEFPPQAGSQVLWKEAKK